MAERLGAGAFFILLQDPELGVLRPAPGFSQTLPGGPTWTELILRASQGGLFRHEVAYPDRNTLVPADVYAAEGGSVFLLIGGQPKASPAEFAKVPLLTALLRAELAQVNASGAAQAAQAASQRATMLAVALDGARKEIEQKAGQLASALNEADRLNGELHMLNETLEQRVAGEIADRMRAEESLRHAQRVEALGQLTGGVAHDINNLLTPIIGSLDLLRKRHNDPRSERQIDAALAAADRAKALVSRLLAFARRQVLQPKSVNVSQAIEGLRDFIVSSIGASIKLVFDIESNIPPARVDPVQLELAIINLAINSRDAMLDGGILNISARSCEITEKHSSGLVPGRYLQISVADSGQGMDEETLRKAIEPFFTTKGVGAGTGLGVSMVDGLAAQSGGKFELSSSVGLGTTATLWLPAADEPAEPPAAESKESVVPPKPALILVVDDEELVRATTVDILADLGYEVVEASSAPAALDLIASGLQPSLIVTDQQMPGMTGRELAREIACSGAALPVLLVTGYDGLALEDIQGLEVLHKPFRYPDLADRVAMLLRSA